MKQVVGVKLLLRGAEGFAKPGMPADGEILVDGGQWPAGAARRWAAWSVRRRPPSESKGW